MSAPQLPQRVLDQLHANLRAAGITPDPADIQGIIDKGFLSRLLDFEQLVAALPSHSTPGYLSAWAPPPANAGSAPSTGFADSPIGELGAQLRSGAISPTELAEQTLAAIAARDPEMNAFQLVLGDYARAAAARAERELAGGQDRGPLHGIPIAVKDLLAMRATRTTAGSKILADNITDFDAAAVERLEAAGAVIVGKTRLSEFAYSPGSNNAHYGPTRNPWHAEHDTGGSSSGSAAAVAAGLVLAALGSDTGGSIRIPASFCGIVGFKPTYGRLSLHGVAPLSWSLDHLGPLTRSVADAALLVGTLAGPDSRDSRTRPGSEFALPNLDTGVRGLRIGVLGDDGSGAALGTPAALAGWHAGLHALERAGAELVPLDMPALEALRLVNGAILALEASTLHEANLRARLADYGEFMRQRVLAAYAYGPRAFVQAQQARATLRRECDALFERVDLISTPAQPGTAPALSTIGSTAFTGPFNALGWPAISVPVGLDGGLPLGLQLAGKPWDDATVLRAARAIEQAIRLPAPA